MKKQKMIYPENYQGRLDNSIHLLEINHTPISNFSQLKSIRTKSFRIKILQKLNRYYKLPKMAMSIEKNLQFWNPPLNDLIDIILIAAPNRAINLKPTPGRNPTTVKKKKKKKPRENSHGLCTEMQTLQSVKSSQMRASKKDIDPSLLTTPKSSLHNSHTLSLSSLSPLTQHISGKLGPLKQPTKHKSLLKEKTKAWKLENKTPNINSKLKTTSRNLGSQSLNRN